MAFNEKEVEKVLDSVESVSGRKLKFVDKKKIITDMPNNGKGNFVVMKKIGDKRFKITVFEDGSEVKKLAFTAPTVKGMTSYGVKAKVLTKIEKPEVVEVEEVAEVTPAVVADVRQTPAERVIDGTEEGSEAVETEEVVGATASITEREDMKEYLKEFGNDLSRASC